jgi:hypothetical protein
MRPTSTPSSSAGWWRRSSRGWPDGPDGREAYRDALGGGDGAWDRARGIALHQAVMLIPYYRETNPGMAALGRRTVGQVLADLRARGGVAAGPGPSARSR